MHSMAKAPSNWQRGGVVLALKVVKATLDLVHPEP
jgi:hypothetical protein